MKNEIKLDMTIPSHTCQLRMVSKISNNIVQEIDCPEKEREILSNQLEVVLTEGLVNAIKHANCNNPEKNIHLQINVSNKILVVRIYDDGIGFDLNAIPSPNFTSNVLEEKGRGIYIMRSLMDSVKYTKTDGGNMLEMTKKLA